MRAFDSRARQTNNEDCVRSVALVISAVSAAASVGCSTGDHGGRAPSSGPANPPTIAPPCPPESPVKIDSVSVPASGMTATIRVDPDPRQIGQNAGGVRWTLKSPPGKTYEFTSDGVTFKAGAPTGPASAVPGNTEYVVCFTATAPSQTWPYTIKFVDKAAPTTVWSCDPTIVNRDTIDPKAGPLTVNCTKQP
jgi:hypothetical protein